MKDGKFDLKTFLNNIELYAGTICFFTLTVMLTLQVISRYVLRHSFTCSAIRSGNSRGKSGFRLPHP